MTNADVAIIGAGPAGLAAALGARAAGAERVLILERNKFVGGVLPQCIHAGFGLYRYGKDLSGPEYAARALEEVERSKAEIVCGATVTGIASDRVITAVTRDGIKKIKAGAIVLASGCRERTRGALMIPGDRPAGVFTAGTAQEIMNLRNLDIGRRAVILGSGDIGLIVARRLRIRGAEVACICEAGAEPSGLTRNIAGCAMEYNIPIYTRTTVSRIIGRSRLRAVCLSDADESMHPIPGTEREVPCDTLILSVGLIPERELTEENAEAGIFLAGNCRKVHQLADMASAEGEYVGKHAAAYALGKPMPKAKLPNPPVLPTGFPKENTVICTICPRGCNIKLGPRGEVSGNFCPKGLKNFSTD